MRSALFQKRISRSPVLLLARVVTKEAKPPGAGWRISLLIPVVDDEPDVEDAVSLSRAWGSLSDERNAVVAFRRRCGITKSWRNGPG